MSREYTADVIMACAFTICDAVCPPFPELDPDAPIEEQARQATDWISDSDYEDAHIRIAIGSASDPDTGKTGFDVCISLTDESVSEEDATTVFVGYELFNSDTDIGTTNGEVLVEIFKPGPWVDHLVTLAWRAIPIVERKSRDA